jgi:preprotein translocase subunit SecG
LAIFAKERAEVAGEAGVPVVEESSAPSVDDAPASNGESADESSEGSSGLPELE